MHGNRPLGAVALSGRIVSVSAAPYDGHPLPVALESLARIGASHVEPAFIVGYTEPFDETAFLPSRVAAYRRALREAGLGCHAVSSHIDLGLPDAVEVFTGRLAFAADIGARIICTNAAARAREGAFRRNMDILLRRAEGFDVVIALENPGDGSDNLFNVAADGLDLVRRFASPYLKLNYDAANTASHRPMLADFAGDAIEALPASAHAHIKDLIREEAGWFFTAIGRGTIGCDRILAALRDYPDLPVSIELPSRIHRGPDARPLRQAMPVPLAAIERDLAASLEAVTARLSP
ncbi:hypothetical protein ASG48_10590 [Aurantimonas sp. Leaf443]|nr:hypothetical protein ASG48_10590 [Aurantimonas sp. Leaf443]